MYALLKVFKWSFLIQLLFPTPPSPTNITLNSKDELRDIFERELIKDWEGVVASSNLVGESALPNEKEEGKGWEKEKIFGFVGLGVVEEERTLPSSFKLRSLAL